MARLTRTDTKLQEILNSRGAPDFSTLDYTAPDFNVRYGLALNWVHQAAEPEELIREAQAYLTQVGRPHDAAVVKNVPFGTQQTMGKIAYCLNRGAQLSPKSYTYIDNALHQAKPNTDIGMENLTLSASGKLIEAYVACYSRIDNLKTLVLKGKMELRELAVEIEKIITKYGHPKVRVRLQEHYAEAFAEAQSDKLIQDWQKPLKAIVRALNSNAEPEQARQDKVLPKAVKAGKAPARKGKAVKTQAKVKAPAAAKPSKDAGKPSVAAQVRALIQDHKGKVNEAQMVDVVVKALGLSTARSKSVVKAFWGKV
jgi:hypothetical protein